jgi:hypothetical protein
MLLRNGSSLGSGPGVHSGASPIGVCLPNGSRAGTRLGFYAGEGTSNGAGDSLADKSGFPNGYGFDGWLCPVKGGGMSVYNTITGSGTVTAAHLSMGKALAAALSGAGTISAASLSLIVQLAAALAGSGTISSATLQAVTSLAAALSGSGSVSAASLSLIVSLDADLSGVGGISAANLRGTASLEADLTALGDLLTSSNVGQLVWAQILEAGFDASRILRIIAAATAGKVSGAPGDEVFRNLGDTKDMIAGTSDEDGNRDSATYGS